MSASDRFVDSYREEAFEILGELETSLLELEKSPRDQNVVDRVFRALHTLKGSGAMVGFETVADLAHEVETLFDLVRKGRVVVNGELISLTLWA
ncbi:MAG: Hpt domain-containing protein [Desulfuromonadales bacterium]